MNPAESGVDQQGAPLDPRCTVCWGSNQSRQRGFTSLVSVLPVIAGYTHVITRQCGQRRNEAHGLSQVPLGVVFLGTGQAEGGVHHRIVHGVVHQSVGLWVETLREETCTFIFPCQFQFLQKVSVNVNESFLSLFDLFIHSHLQGSSC